MRKGLRRRYSLETEEIIYLGKGRGSSIRQGERIKVKSGAY